jgi:ribonuclease HI
MNKVITKKNQKQKNFTPQDSFEKLKYEINNQFPKNKPEQTFYVIEKGRSTGLVGDHLLFQHSITDFKGATYKKFSSNMKAKEYLRSTNQTVTDFDFKRFYYDSKQVLINDGIDTFFYVDGSINFVRTLFSSGFVLEKKGEYVKEQSFTFNFNSTTRKFSNETEISEFYAAMLAVIEAQKLGLTRFAIVYDNTEILRSLLKRSKTNELQKLYFDWMKRETAGMEIEYLKAKSHKGIKGNDRVDRLVKNAILYPRKVY